MRWEALTIPLAVSEGGCHEALLQGQADAVVFDAPVLLYYASHGGKGKVQVIGTVFRKENYGIILPTNSPYRKPINKKAEGRRRDGSRIYPFAESMILLATGREQGSESPGEIFDSPELI